MKRISVLILSMALIILLLTGCSVLGDDTKKHMQEYDKPFWTAAHYFANGWPMNMWDSEFETLDGDLQRIKSDGFNSIILLVPWREFQPLDINKYNNNALDKLDWIFEKAKENDLGVVLRLGYFWDYYNIETSELYARYEGVIANNEYMPHWLDYSETIYSVASKHENFFGAFICWEDFWGVVGTAKGVAGINESSNRYAEFLGYDKYLLSYNDTNTVLDNVSLDNKVYIPSIESPSFETFYQFIDNRLLAILYETQSVFPGLSMEVRADYDLIKDKSGQNSWYSHEETYGCESADYTTMVYGIPMGFENVGEKINAKTALKMTEYILNNITEKNSAKRLFIDQFLFYDNTPGFEHNAQLQQEEIDDYLSDCADILLKYSRGYGIWTYRDYYFDAVSNGEFAKELKNWETENGVSVEKIYGSNRCVLPPNASIKQYLNNKVDTGETVCTFDVIPLEDNAVITVVLNEQVKYETIENKKNIVLKFKGNISGMLEINSNKKVCIDNIKVYNFCQQGLLYDAEWNEQDFIESIRKLNENLLQ